MLGDRIVITNRIEELRRMSQWLRDSANEADIGTDLLQKLDVCANEAVANIIFYAYDDEKSHDITLELAKTASGAALVIRDDGRPFNPVEAPEHTTPTGLEDAQIGGLGVHLMRRMLSRLDYQRADGINVLYLEACAGTLAGNA